MLFSTNRYHAAIGLGNLEDRDNKSQDLIIWMLKDEEHPSVKLAAAYALFQMGHEQQATPILNEGLEAGLLYSLCKKTPTTSLFLFLNQSFTKSKLLGFKNFESLVFGAFLSKTKKP